MAMISILVVLMLVLFAGAWMLWRSAYRQNRRAASSAFIDKRLSPQPAVGSALPVAAAAQKKRVRSGVPHWERLLLRAGKRATAGFYVKLAVPVLALTAAAWLLSSALAAAIAFVVAAVLTYFRLWLIADRRQRRMVSQLPNFLENVVRLIMIGNSMGAAFQSASQSLEEPLKDVIGRAASLNRSGKELDVALAQVAVSYSFAELRLVSAVVAIATRFGGRSDQVLERMAGFIRDIEQARAELVALSAEVRLSAWILALLPIGIAAYIVIFNTSMFTRMWEDPTGFKMLVIAVGLQLFGSWWLYRMAKSV